METGNLISNQGGFIITLSEVSTRQISSDPTKLSPSNKEVPWSGLAVTNHDLSHYGSFINEVARQNSYYRLSPKQQFQELDALYQEAKNHLIKIGFDMSIFENTWHFLIHEVYFFMSSAAANKGGPNNKYPISNLRNEITNHLHSFQRRMLEENPLDDRFHEKNWKETELKIRNVIIPVLLDTYEKLHIQK